MGRRRRARRRRTPPPGLPPSPPRVGGPRSAGAAPHRATAPAGHARAGGCRCVHERIRQLQHPPSSCTRGRRTGGCAACRTHQRRGWAAPRAPARGTRGTAGAGEGVGVRQEGWGAGTARARRLACPALPCLWGHARALWRACAGLLACARAPGARPARTQRLPLAGSPGRTLAWALGSGLGVTFLRLRGLEKMSSYWAS